MFRKKQVGVRNTERANTIYVGVMKDLFASAELSSGKVAPFTLLACNSETDQYGRGLQKFVCRMRDKTRG